MPEVIFGLFFTILWVFTYYSYNIKLKYTLTMLVAEKVWNPTEKAILLDVEHEVTTDRKDSIYFSVPLKIQVNISNQISNYLALLCKKCHKVIYEQVTLLVEVGKAVDVGCLNFSKAFDTVSHSRLLEMLAAHSLNRGTLLG